MKTPSRVKKVMFSHNSDEWQTPQDLFDSLNEEFGPLICDVAATKENNKCAYWIGMEEDALTVRWMSKNWCNPPYSKVKEFAAKAVEEQKNGKQTVMLIPARTDTRFFHDYIYEKPGVKVRFLKGRVKFINPEGPLLRGNKMNGSNDAAPFPSMVVIFSPLP